MSGKNSEIYNSWRSSLLKILANVEAKIDFPDEDLPKKIINEIQSTSSKIKSEIKKVLNDKKSWRNY